MFELLTRVLLLLLIATILWYVFVRFIPRTYLTWLGGLIVFAFVVLAFIEPNNGTVGAVWSILSLPLKPLGLTIFLLLSALKDGTKKIVANQVLAALLILLLSSMPISAYWLTAQAERAVSGPVTYQSQQVDTSTIKAIVVLGDDTDPADPAYRSRTQVGNAQDGFINVLASRLLYAARLYQEQVSRGLNPLLIVSVGPQLDLNAPMEGQAAATQTVQGILVSAGVPPDRVIVQTTGADLYGSVIEVEQTLGIQGFRKEIDTILLLAPALNIGRGISTFASRGIRVVPEPTDRFIFQLQNGQLLARVADLVPNVEALALTTRVVEEYLTSVYYFLRGWLVSPL